jgi:inorganic triphosphatase YgiF
MPVEREIKLDVSSDYRLPDLSDASAGISAEDRGVHVLRATYWDTANLDLLRRGFGLRYRTTDGGEGQWTVKGATTRQGIAVVRDEVNIEGDGDRPPDVALRSVEVSPRALAPVARLETSRHIVDLVTTGGRRWAELCDDTVHILDGMRSVTTFRELELEILGEADDPRVLEVISKLRAAGASEPRHGAKYVRALRALGYALPAPDAKVHSLSDG